MSKITFQNKVNLNEDSSIAAINKVRDVDLNEIKSVVNENDDNVGDLTDLHTSDVSSVVNAINELAPVVLYENASGTTGDITLSDSRDNYTYVEIFFKRGSQESSVKITGNSASLITATVTLSNQQAYIGFKNVEFSGTSMTVTSYQDWYNVTGTQNVNASGNNTIAIFKILGYK